MSTRAQTRTILAHTSQLRRAASFLPAPAAPTLVPCSSLSTSSPKDRFFAWQGPEANGERTAWFTRCLLLQPDRWRTRAYSSIAVRLRRHPNAIQPFMQVSPYSAISPRIFPAHPRSLALVLIPRPAALAVLLRTSCALRVWVSKQKSSAQQTRGCGPECGRDFSSEPPQKARLRPWERGTSRRFAQECPEGNPGKYKQGETRWHSTLILCGIGAV